MASIWLTYAWVDNEAKDVDFVIYELRREGLTVNWIVSKLLLVGVYGTR